MNPIATPSVEDLRAAIQLACQAQNAHRIEAGRHQVLAMPLSWVLERIEQVAAESLDLSDYWEYRRLLELVELLDVTVLERLISLGLGSSDPDVRETAQDYKTRIKKRI
jgi:hypothetical protein